MWPGFQGIVRLVGITRQRFVHAKASLAHLEAVSKDSAAAAKRPRPQCRRVDSESGSQFMGVQVSPPAQLPAPALEGAWPLFNIVVRNALISNG